MKDDEKIITIVGITGKMGTWFAKFFLERDWRVFGYSRTEDRLNQLMKGHPCFKESEKLDLTSRYHDCIPHSDWVLLSIPIPAHEAVIHEVAPLMKNGAIVVDIASVKGRIPEILRNAKKKHGINVLSTHPMFGPGASSMKNKNFILIDLQNDKTILKRFRALIEPEGPIIIESTPSEHDKYIAFTLALPHFMNLLFAKILREHQIDINLLKKFGGTTFHLQHLISQEVTLQEPFIYGTIEMENPAFKDLLRPYQQSSKEMIEIIKNGNYQAFERTFLDLREFYAKNDDYKSVMERFNAAAAISTEMLEKQHETSNRGDE
ncbi:prephenate dehydrogenase/arogenate dehydrogenase family protein [Candidatus Bathyarchaeota archaeon]|nr:prephenate dehydrogenase/arogenate dehydrogenase family protein [Candidatus Bathyarchaeota archaeon]